MTLSEARVRRDRSALCDRLFISWDHLLHTVPASPAGARSPLLPRPRLHSPGEGRLPACRPGHPLTTFDPQILQEVLLLPWPSWDAMHPAPAQMPPRRSAHLPLQLTCSSWGSSPSDCGLWEGTASGLLVISTAHHTAGPPGRGPVLEEHSEVYRSRLRTLFFCSGHARELNFYELLGWRWIICPGHLNLSQNGLRGQFGVRVMWNSAWECQG